MKIVVMGTGAFILPSLKLLAKSHHEIIAVITMPLRVPEGKKRVTVPPVRSAAAELGYPLFSPENINSQEGLSLLEELKPDLLFVCDYGKILSPTVLDLARFGAINLHGSLLPKYRGAAPIARAIQAGEKVFGVSVIHLVPEMDAGPILTADSWEPDPDQTAVEIEFHLSQLGAPIVMAAIEQLEQGSTTPLPQDPTLASPAPRLRKEEGRILWKASSHSIINQYRAFQPWPKTFSFWRRTPEGEPLRILLGPFRVSSCEGEESKTEPGTLLLSKKGSIRIRTEDGALEILALQPAGRNSMPPDAFLRGYPLQDGDRFF